jgi:ribosomal protein S18 acetylase RimI-like enzyme
MAITIRPATLDDARGIAEVHVRGWQIGYRDYFSTEFLAALSVDERELRWREGTLRDSSITLLVAVESDRVIGFTSYGLNHDALPPTVGEMYALYVDPEHWNRGAGTMLITASEAGLADARYESAVLWTLGPNQRTRAFYERRGWRSDGTTKPHHTGVELVRYAKQLAPAARPA